MTVLDLQKNNLQPYLSFTIQKEATKKDMKIPKDSWQIIDSQGTWVATFGLRKDAEYFLGAIKLVRFQEKIYRKLGMLESRR